MRVDERTANVASTYPFDATKKNCTPLLACASVRTCGSVGRSAGEPLAVLRKVRWWRSTPTVESIALSDAGRSGVL